MPEPQYERIHPLTILIEAWRAISRMLFLIAIALFNAFRGHGGGDFSELMLSGLGILVAFQAVFRYLTFKFAIHQGSLVIKQGLLNKQDRTIPLERIQNINLRRDLIHRLLGLVDLEVETAAGGKAEAVISAVTEEQAHRIKQRLTGTFDPTESPILARRKEEVVYTASPKELIVAGATENKLLMIIAAVFGLFAVAPGARSAIIESVIRSATVEASHGAKGFFTITVIVIAALLFGWAASVVMAFVTYYQFEVTFHEGRFRRSYGLFNHYENVVPIRRIQILRLTENFLQQWLQVGKLYMDTAGAFSEKHQGEHKHEASRPSPLMAPIISRHAVDPLVQRVLPGLDLEREDWQRVPKTVIVRHILGSLPGAVVMGAAAAFFAGWWGAAVFAALVATGAASGWSAWRRTGWHEDGDRLVVRQGNLWRTTVVIPIDKVQKVQLDQGPFQRLFRLSNLTLATAASGMVSMTALKDIDESLAGELALKFHQRSALNAWRNPDGF